jgi:Xaa-Pro aminopeptidase
MKPDPHAIERRLAQVRARLAAHGADALFVPSADPHLSEYLPERWKGRTWLSGFTGSVGTLAVTSSRAALFADSRYWEQAQREIEGTGVELVKVVSAAGMGHADWLAGNVPQGGTVMADPNSLGLSAAHALRTRLESAGIRLRTEVDLLDEAWSDRPVLPRATVYAHRPPHAVRGRAEKLSDVRADMQARGATHHFVSTLDDIAWITNLRGADVEFNPVFLAHLLIDSGQATLFVAQGKVSTTLAGELAADGIRVEDYDAARTALGALPADSKVMIDPRRIALGLRTAIPPRVDVIECTNPSTLLKSRKTAAELHFFRETMVEDGAAMCRFYADFEASLARGDRWNECMVHERLTAERAKSRNFVSPSFATIAGFNANGALPHYRATEEHQATIEGDGLLLIDSGGQYLGGTTDITRTWAIGQVTDEMRRDFTLVLKGMIALTRARFPRGTPSPMLDAIARVPLWAHGLDYGHGTGHGVGYFLNVHEDPQRIGKLGFDATMGMEPGMVTSNEPGLYRPGRWGVRIENLVATVPAPDAGFGEFLEFETLTLCPIDRRCIDPGLLDELELRWLDEYHATVRQRLAPSLDGMARQWLEERTAVMPRHETKR